MNNMIDDKTEKLLKDLQERRKELNCLYRLEKWLHDTESPLETVFAAILEIIPDSLQYPEIARAKIEYLDQTYHSPEYNDTPWRLDADIRVRSERVGQLTVVYNREVPMIKDGYFLEEEVQMFKSIADRIGHMIFSRELKQAFSVWEDAKTKLTRPDLTEWRVIVDLLQKSNPQLFMYISQKMLHYLCWNGVTEAAELLSQTPAGTAPRESAGDDMNQPSQKRSIDNIMTVNKEIFRIASENLGEDQILAHIHGWIEEEKSRFLVKTLESPNSSISDLIKALTRFQYLEEENISLTASIDKSLRVSLIRHFFSDQLEYINIAKNHIHINDYYNLVKRIIFPGGSHGKLGGKSAGLFLACRILRKSPQFESLFKDIKVPKTWYITSDGLSDFLQYNNLENVLEQKYKELDEIHVEYSNIIQIFKNSHFSPEIIRGLSMAIDDIGDVPIIVRSSSLLEDRFGAAFSGKYKSLFLANQGPREKRLESLMDAIAEIYASTFAPDPIEYRKERGLLDFDEEMGIMIQEVVGTRVGNYFFPTFAGVAFSNNEFRWSPRIQREDGLIRLVHGLGTRAVDRTADDYPILVAPGKPDMRVNVTPDEVIRYSPKYIDVLDLETNKFKTIAIDALLAQYGDEIPGVQHLVSIIKDNFIQSPTSLLNIDFEKDQLVVTFETLFQRTDFVKQMAALLKVLEENMGTAVDIEFAHDGKNLHLLQCRPQSHSRNFYAAPIPKDIPEEKIAFSANRYISSGFVPDILHVVYVDADAYNRLPDLTAMKNVGRAVGKLNKILPKRQFILMGPGRWGSRGDIKLGVEVSYSDINNTAILIEMARKSGNYIPELSFGTHFFQDLVEASIRYIPLYPDDEGIVFNESFFTRSENILAHVAPEFAYLSDVIKVIDVPRTTGGLILRVLMNGDLDEAVAIFQDPDKNRVEPQDTTSIVPRSSEDYWRWRFHIAEQIAQQTDPDRFGVKGFYIFGSTKNASAGPGSDIDLLLHIDGSETQKRDLQLWLEGWSLTLAEINYQRTGYKSHGLLDVHMVTDDDIRNKTSFAVKINAVTDAARPLKMKGQ